MRYFILIAILLCSCNPCKKLQRKCPPVIVDSIVEIITLDTLILVSPADTLYLEIPVQPTLQDLIVDSPGPKLSIKVKEKIIEIQVVCPEDSLKAIITELESREVKTIRVPVEVPVKYTSKFAKICIIGFISCIILLGVWVYFKIKSGALRGVLRK